MVQNAASIFTAFAMIAILFQLAMAAGAPWGEYAMGGRFPGQFPSRLRMMALVQGAVMALWVLVVLDHAGLLSARAEKPGFEIWLVTVLCGMSFVMNTITPSAKERKLWAPLTFILFASSFYVALNRS